MALAVTQLIPRECKAQLQKVQTSFCETGSSDEQEQMKPIPLPKEVLTAVTNSREVREALANAKKVPSDLDLAKMLIGVSIQLSNNRSRYFILKSETDPITGGDNTWFWIVRQSGDQAKTLLWMGANCIEILPARTHGYRDIVAHWSSAAVTKTEIYKFDGRTYKLRHSRWRNRKPSDDQ